MAKEDYNVADRNADFPVTAGDKVAETVYETPDTENAEAAEAAGLLSAAFIDYDEALTALGERDDMESFDSYTRRTYGLEGATFAAGEHMRERPNRSGGNGFAPDPDNAIVTDGGTDSGV
jgi:hypothetical protein